MSCPYNHNAFQPTPPNRRTAFIQASVSKTKVKEFLYLDHLSPSDSKLEDSPPRYLTRGFLEKRAKFGERKPLGLVEKVEEGGGDFYRTQQEAGSMRLMQPSFLKKPIKVRKHREANEEPMLSLPESRERIITVKEAEKC